MALGPSGWEWVFLVNVPIGVVAVVLTLRAVPAVPGIGLREGADVTGSVLVTGGLMLLVLTVVKAADYTWGDTRTLGLSAASLVLVAAFVVRQAHAAKPLLPLRIFRSRIISGANVIMLLMIAGLFGFQFCTALYLQNALGFDALKTGLAFLPVPVTIAVVSLGLAARLNRRFGARPVLLGGLLLVAVALALPARAPGDGRLALLRGTGCGATAAGCCTGDPGRTWEDLGKSSDDPQGAGTAADQAVEGGRGRAVSR